MKLNAIKWIFVTLVVSSFCLELALITLIAMWYDRLSESTEAKYCVTRENMNSGKRNPGWFNQLKYEGEESAMPQEYCIAASQALTCITRKMTDKRYDKDINPEYNPSNLTMFNCQIDKGIKSIVRFHYSGPGKSSNIQWTSDIKTDSDIQSLEDEEGDIYFHKSGHYFVNVQLTYKIENISCFANDENIVHLQVVHIPSRQDNKIVILENINSMCQLADITSEKSINVGAAIYLKKDDKVHVVMSHPHLLVSGNGKDHLSVYQI